MPNLFQAGWIMARVYPRCPWLSGRTDVMLVAWLSSNPSRVSLRRLP